MNSLLHIERLSPEQRAEAARRLDEELRRRGYDPQKFVSECYRAQRESAVATVDEEGEPSDRWSEWLLWPPYPVQQDFIDSDIKELAWGGEAGGSKTVGQIMSALRFVDVPHYSAIIFRKVEDDLHKAGSLIPLAHEFLQGTAAQWSEKLLQWRFPSGATLSFAGLNDKNAHYRYQTSAFQYIGFDELAHWPNDKQFRYMFSRLRKGKRLVDVPLRMRPTFNPGGAGAEWVAARYGLDKNPLFKMPPSRQFMASKRSDNTELDQESYLETLAELDVVERAQLMHGDFTACPIGRYFRKDWFKFVNEAPPLTKWVRGWDTGASEHGDYTAGVMLGVFGRKLYIRDVVRGKWETPEVRNKIWEVAKDDGPDVSVAVEEAFCGIAAIQELRRNPDLDRFNLVGIKVHRDKELRCRGWRNRLGNGEVYLVRGGWNDDFIEECLKFTNEDTNVDDQVDATSVAFETVFRSDGGVDQKDQAPKRGSLEESLKMRGISRDDDDFDDEE